MVVVNPRQVRDFAKATGKLASPQGSQRVESKSMVNGPSSGWFRGIAQVELLPDQLGQAKAQGRGWP